MSLTKRYFHDKIVERDTNKSLHQLFQYDELQQEFLNEKINTMQLHSSGKITTLKVNPLKHKAIIYISHAFNDKLKEAFERIGIK